MTGKEPQGCVEKGKPALEQGCTPPPTEEDKRNQYFNCLCRCSSGWAGHIGVWYDPEGKSEPECKSSGPCFGGAGAWGCTRRHFFVGPNDCGKGCWEAAFGKDTYDPKKADDLRKNENKKYKKPLTVKINPSKNPADFGDIITLQAEAGEGSGGYSFKWGGCAQDAKDAQAKVANTRDCKPCEASVTVTDQDGDSASGSVTIQCNTVKVKLTKESPKENTVPVGGKATFYAEVFSGDKPFSGPTLFYVWERNPDAIFGDPKNPRYETSAGSQTRNTATFRKAGTTPVWVTVQREIDGRKVTIGESEQIPITVANPPDELTTEEAKVMILDLAAFGAPVLLFSGGEPVMRPDLPELAQFAVDHGMRAVISTNGTLITKEKAKTFREIGLSYVGVSLDGMKATHDRFRGVAGAFDAAIQGIRTCRELGIKVGVRFTINRHNVADVPAIFDLLEKEEIPRCCFYHLVYSGRGSKLIEEDLSHAETRKLLDLIMDRTRDLFARGIPKEILTVDNHADGPYVYLRLLKEDQKRAAEVLELLKMNEGNSTGHGIGCISWDGEVHPDQFWRGISFGNVRNRPFSRIWTDTTNPLLAKLKDKRPHVTGKCATCRWLDVCGGNFRARSEAVTGDIWSPDPACYLTDDEIKTDKEE